MAYPFTPGAGAAHASEVVGGEHHSRFAMEFGIAGQTPTPISATNPLPIREPVKGAALSKGGVVMSATTSTALAPTNSSRTTVEISNGSATQGIWLSFGSAAVSGQGTYLPPQATGFWPTSAAVFGIITTGGTTGGAVGWTEWGT